MRTIIAGSRGLGYPDLLAALRACPWAAEISSVVAGGARGVDSAAAAWALHRRLPLAVVRAQWTRPDGRYDPQAGYARNRAMAALEGVEALLAVWDGRSRGTEDMISIARRKGLRTFVHGAR